MTMLLGIIGDPIAHSLSPIMQNRALEAAGLDATYLPYHVRSPELKAFIEDVHQQNMTGFNVTVPHKVSIMKYLDEVDEEAHQIGAVNTVLYHEGRLSGYNTDARGYCRSLQEEARFSAKDKAICILGAGGAARAVAYGLLTAGATNVMIANRTAEKAEALVQSFAHDYPHRITHIPWEPKTLGENFGKCDLLINTTTVGLDGTRFDRLPLAQLPGTALVSDLVYSPRETPLLREAKEAGFSTHEGLGMLLYQGAESFRIWTGIEPDIKVMRKALEEALEK